MIRYHEAGAKAKARVLELLRGLSAELQSELNILVFASMLLVIAKALFSHVRFVNVLLLLVYFSDKTKFEEKLQLEIKYKVVERDFAILPQCFEIWVVKCQMLTRCAILPKSLKFT